MKRIWIGMTSAIVLLNTVLPAAMASTSSSRWFKMAINENATIISTPYGVAQNDGIAVTTYVPVYYVNQALTRLGYKVTWNGASKTWAIVTTQASLDFSSLPASTGNTTLTVNGTVVTKLDTVVERDPASDINTTYVPIYYLGTLFKVLGLSQKWNGTTATWSINQPSVTTTTGTPVSSTLKPPTIAVSQKGSSKDISVSGAVSGSLITLYDSNGDELLTASANTDGTTTFYNMGVGTYYVIEQTNGVISKNSNEVTISTNAKTMIPSLYTNSSNGIWYIIVNNAAPNASVTLYNTDGTIVTSSATNQYGIAYFYNVDMGSYYVIVKSTSGNLQSSALTVNQDSSTTAPTTTTPTTPAPSTTTTPSTTTITAPILTLNDNSGVYSLTITRVNPYASITLYTSSGSIYTTLSATLAGTAIINSLPSGTYYAIQKANGVQSTASNDVTVNTTPTTPTLSVDNYNGVYTLIITNVEPYATVTVYTSTGSTYTTLTANASGTATIGTIAAGTFYAVQTANGVQSAASQVVTIA